MNHRVDADVARELMKRWLRSKMHGCQFATRLMVKKSLGLFVLEDGLPELANSFLTIAEKSSLFAILILPYLNTEEDLVNAVQALCENERWRYSLLEEKEPGYCYIKLEWLTDYGKWSNCLGLDPSRSMPATRRSPFTAIGLWPGNTKPQWPKKKKVGLIDTPSPFDELTKDEAGKTAHRRALEWTTDNVQQFFESEEEMVYWRDVAFRLGKADK